MGEIVLLKPVPILVLLRTRACRAAFVSASASGAIIVGTAVWSFAGTALGSSRKSLASESGSRFAFVRTATSTCKPRNPRVPASPHLGAAIRPRRPTLRADRRRRRPAPCPSHLVRISPKWRLESPLKSRCRQTHINESQMQTNAHQ